MVPVFEFYFYPEFSKKQPLIKPPSTKNVKFRKLTDLHSKLEELFNEELKE